MRRLSWAALAVLAAVLAVGLPYMVNGYLIYVIDIAIIFMLLALGLCLSLGIAGQINLGQVAFFGVAAYACAIFTVKLGWGFWPAAVLAVVVAVLAGLLIGIPALRVQSHYLGIVTLGLSLAFTALVANLSIAGQAEGLLGLPVPPLGGVDLSSHYLYYYLEVAALVLFAPFAYFVVYTRFGRRLRAMRDDNLAAASTGVEVPLARMASFALAGFFGGIAGVLYAGLVRYVSPPSFNIETMFLLLAMVIIGGRFSLTGTLVGVVVLTVVREVLSDYASYAQLVYGALIVLMVVFAPTGLAGAPRRVAQLFRRGTTEAAGGTGPFVPSSTEHVSVSGDGPAGPALEVDELSKRFRGLNALDQVSIRVDAGMIHGIVGPNGSGKTTLFNTVSGIYTCNGGRVRLFGRDVTDAKAYRLSQLGVARTFQNLRLFGRLTVRDNILVAMDRSRLWWGWRYVVWPVGVWRGERALRQQAQALLVEYGLAAVADTLPAELPYGTQRRVEIARAMAAAPRLLLLDEPAAGLNQQETNQLAEIVRSVRDRGTTVVLIEHNMSLVMSLCDRVTVLSNGAVIADDVPEVVANDPEVIRAYLGGSRELDPAITPSALADDEATATASPTEASR
jgi:branched-chain amino acid transport system permease protein